MLKNLSKSIILSLFLLTPVSAADYYLMMWSSSGCKWCEVAKKDFKEKKPKLYITYIDSDIESPIGSFPTFYLLRKDIERDRMVVVGYWVGYRGYDSFLKKVEYVKNNPQRFKKSNKGRMRLL